MPAPRAETYAQAAGRDAGPDRLHQRSGGEASPRPMYTARWPWRPPVPVAPGEQSVTADVTVVWEIH